MRINHSSFIFMLAVLLDLFLVCVRAEAPPAAKADPAAKATGEDPKKEGEVAKTDEEKKEGEESPTAGQESADSSGESGSMFGLLGGPESEPADKDKSFWQRHKKTIIWCIVIFFVVIIVLAIVGFVLKRRKS